MDELTSENATHLLECRHCIGNHGRTYYMRCHILKRTKGLKVKILVFGERYWKGKEHIRHIKYVDAYRITEIEGHTNG